MRPSLPNQHSVLRLNKSPTATVSSDAYNVMAVARCCVMATDVGTEGAMVAAAPGKVVGRADIVVSLRKCKWIIMIMIMRRQRKCVHSTHASTRARARTRTYTYTHKDVKTLSFSWYLLANVTTGGITPPRKVVEHLITLKHTFLHS